MKNNFTKMIFLFLAGLLVGGAIVWLCFCGCCNKHCDHKCLVVKPPLMKNDPVSIDTVTAKNYFHNYMLSPVSVDTLKALVVNLEQYHAMSLILNADPKVMGFRIYMGATDTTGTTPVMMVVGFGTPDHTETIYTTSADDSGTCPFICDVDSPITNEY
jgi:hypothetical protein